ncbi:uncharacterized protein PV06_06633 [Exophiala oligosperma]|uniref:Uncharacterized protein n=1 Tax=Exophiala oligosperma TaxID=215243 RepID=A0A0D2AM79_9EURO|nr:uncharacterized protein PV06_06633 [Exophiala oligosperma]KIW41036.1 hypothetical protein PV06_06633 [Exophiala oligosperma]
MLSSPSKDTAQSPLLEGELEKLNAEYASAIEENQAAQSKYEDALERRRRRSQSNKGDDRDSSHNPRTLLNRHVELRSLQKRNTSFVVLKDELDKIKSLLDSAKWKVRPAAAQEQLTVPPDARNDISLLEHTLMRHVKALEMAVVQSHLEAKAEKAKLDKARVRAQSDEHGVTPEQRVRAMLTTRRHLTKWLEESLEKCQDNFGEHGGDDKDVQDPGPGQNGEVITDDMIDEQYERYLDARRRIIDAVDNLRAPIPFKGGESTEQQPHEEQGKATRQKGLGGSAVLNNVERNLLPSLRHNSVVKSHLALIREQLDDEARATKNMLDRLSDESQLLQAFPILARSGRFEHAASAIGTKSEAREDQVGDDEVAQRIKPWLFAAEAAEVALSSNMEKQLGQGTEAMHTVSRSLAELSLLKNTRLDENFVL